jgi:hypothetical protein
MSWYKVFILLIVHFLLWKLLFLSFEISCFLFGLVGHDDVKGNIVMLVIYLVSMGIHLAIWFVIASRFNLKTYGITVALGIVAIWVFIARFDVFAYLWY